MKQQNSTITVGRTIRPLLYRTSPLDLPSFAMAAALMLVVGITASAWPALEAARTDPSAALRSE